MRFRRCPGRRQDPRGGRNQRVRMRAAIAGVLFCVVLAGCAGGGSGAAPSPSPSPTPCPATTTDPGSYLVSPSPGSSGVPDNVGSITVAYGTYDVRDFGVVLTPSDGSSPIYASVSAQNVPPQNGVATIPIPALKAHVTYAVSGMAYNTTHVACVATLVASFGSFTTQ